MPRSSAVTEAPSGSSASPGATLTGHQARAYCARLARDHYENFPVASWLVPKHQRPAVQAIYAFARVADDFADEAPYEGQRLERLDEWERLLHDCFRGRAIDPVFVALREAVLGFALPLQPFRDLLTAFRMDVTKKRYESEADLLEYCRLSANPRGRLMLMVFGRDDEALRKRSDAICTALQLANHWQDVAIDLKKDRIYIPEEALRRFAVGEDDLRSGRATEAFRALMRDRVERTRALFAAGRPL